MLKKVIKNGSLELKADGPEGAFRAVFATFNVIDRDRDVTIPGAFKSGQDVRISQWGHNWGMPVIGKGTIDQDDSKAWVDGQFFLDMQAGKETYLSVKNLGNLQEWSYGFDITEWSVGEWEGEQDVRILRGLDVHEVSPVMLGAGVGTGTEDIKAAKDRHDQLVALKSQTQGMLRTIDLLIGSTESDGAPADEAGNGKSGEGEGAKDETSPIRLLTDRDRVELELLAL